ncbi:MAG: SWIM zinc finger family protein [Patescibacteria group bacterium]
MNLPLFNLDKIKFGVDERTFQKALALYEIGRVTNFGNNGFSFTADVLGSRPYKVVVLRKKFNEGNCECYLGQNETLCKHMVAVAIYAVLGGREIKEEERKQVTKPEVSGVVGELNTEELKKVKEEIIYALKFIKYYSGPSKTWFAYQDSLWEGKNRLSSIISKLPISKQTADLIIGVLLRLDKKIQNGVDDSDGTVGGFIEETVDILKDFPKYDAKIIESFKKLAGISSCFGWEESLVKMITEN